MELDETLAEAHASLAMTEWVFDWNWPSAEREFKRAIELNPNSARSRSHYLVGLISRARFEESLAEGERVQEVDSLLPTELPYA